MKGRGDVAHSARLFCQNVLFPHATVCEAALFAATLSYSCSALNILIYFIHSAYSSRVHFIIARYFVLRHISFARSSILRSYSSAFFFSVHSQLPSRCQCSAECCKSFASGGIPSSLPTSMWACSLIVSRSVESLIDVSSRKRSEVWV